MKKYQAPVPAAPVKNTDFLDMIVVSTACCFFESDMGEDSLALSIFSLGFEAVLFGYALLEDTVDVARLQNCQCIFEVKWNESTWDICFLRHPNSYDNP
jgi:hypothetical protein